MKAQSLSHTAWDCKYHIVWIPKYRRKSLYKELRQYVLGWAFAKGIWQARRNVG